MTLAPYFGRTAVAAAQVLDGYDLTAIQERLEGTVVAVCADEATMKTLEGRLLAEMSCRLLARLYPELSLRVDGPQGARLADLAERINPHIEVTERRADIEISIGTDAPEASDRRV